MRPRFNVVCGDIFDIPSDLLLLKQAQGSCGVDERVANRLIRIGKCAKKDLEIDPNSHVIVETDGGMRFPRVLFLGAPALWEFRYAEMRTFATRAMEVIAMSRLPLSRLTTTIHGAGYGLDEEEAILSLVAGFEAAFSANPSLEIEEISFVERVPRRAEILTTALNKRLGEGQSPAALDPAPTAWPLVNAVASNPSRAPAELPAKRHAFVAMPFSEAFEDVYQYGIYAPVRACGLICEKTNESAFTGDILQRIKDRIETADVVVADLTEGRPNVYLEVGYAWGKGVPVIFVARHGEELHFDVTRHRCIYYKSIRHLGQELEKLIRGILEIA